ncbi:MAG: glycosyltransferase family 4 protein [Burkholderiaceae bacterium]|nr:glycosyltransferase family 4 protein [Burkholderiaceae bacterium]
MARELTLAYPGDINTLTGGYIYDKRILAELGALGWTTHTLSLDQRFPAVQDTIKEQSARLLAEVATDRTLVIDGLALGALGQYAKIIKAQRPFVALVHHPLALESGIDPVTAKDLKQSEYEALSEAAHVIVTSQITKQTLIDQYSVTASHITVVEPGVDRPAELAEMVPTKTSRSGQTTQSVKLLSVGALVPRKGVDVLITALGQVADLDWQLDIVGDYHRAPAYTDEINALIQKLGLEQKIKLLGAQAAEQLSRLYESADVFVLASRYEGYGMAYTEALAWGLPVDRPPRVARQPRR